MISVEHLTKKYRIQKSTEGKFSGINNFLFPKYVDKLAINDISFTINDGEIVGYIGPNGAGKSTTIKMLSGILLPTSGEVRVNGLVPHINRREHAQNIGVVFGQKTSLWWDVPVIDSLKLLRDMYQIEEAQFKRNLLTFDDMLNLHTFINQPVRQLSLGQRMRADLAAALLHNPKIIFLDEPTIGVDVVTKERLRTFIKEIHKERNVTVLLTTHDMNDMEKLVNRVIIIGDGKIAYDGSMLELRRIYGFYHYVTVTFQEDQQDIILPELQLLRSEPYRKTFAFDQNKITADKVLTLLGNLTQKIQDITINEMDIEEVVRKIYAENFEKKV